MSIGWSWLIRIYLGAVLLLPVCAQYTAADNFCLEAVTALIIRSRSAQELERNLNKPNNEYNNLDLDGNGVIDFITVTEINNHRGRGFSLSVEVSENDVQELAFVQLEHVPNTNSVYVETLGSPHLYGEQYLCHCTRLVSEVTIWKYLLREHIPYQSPYSFDNYPKYYLRRKQKDTQKYKNYHLAQSYQREILPRGTSSLKSVVQSPHAHKTAQTIKAPLFNPMRPRGDKDESRRRNTHALYFRPATQVETPFSYPPAEKPEVRTPSLRPPVIRPTSHPKSRPQK